MPIGASRPFDQSRTQRTSGAISDAPATSTLAVWRDPMTRLGWATTSITGTITPGGPAYSTTVGAGDTVSLTFAGTAGQRISWRQTSQMAYATVLRDPNA